MSPVNALRARHVTATYAQSQSTLALESTCTGSPCSSFFRLSARSSQIIEDRPGAFQSLLRDEEMIALIERHEVVPVVLGAMRCAECSEQPAEFFETLEPCDET
jgi:hypothetical protein